MTISSNEQYESLSRNDVKFQMEIVQVFSHVSNDESHKNEEMTKKTSFNVLKTRKLNEA